MEVCPPSTVKLWLQKAIAGEAKSVLYHIWLDFVEMLVGVRVVAVLNVNTAKNITMHIFIEEN